MALDRVMKNRSVITIAHRLSTIQNAGKVLIHLLIKRLFDMIDNGYISFVDQIAVIHKGGIVEQGTYEELIRLDNGRFRALIRQ